MSSASNSSVRGRDTRLPMTGVERDIERIQREVDDLERTANDNQREADEKKLEARESKVEARERRLDARESRREADAAKMRLQKMRETRDRSRSPKSDRSSAFTRGDDSQQSGRGQNLGVHRNTGGLTWLTGDEADAAMDRVRNTLSLPYEHAAPTRSLMTSVRGRSSHSHGRGVSTSQRSSTSNSERFGPRSNSRR